MRGFLDRDFLKTVEGFLFCVVGAAHPRNRVIAYLKYVPSHEGRWGRHGDVRYTRTMPDYTIPSLAANLQLLTTQYPRYIFHSRVLHVTMSAVPTPFIVAHYAPEQQLHHLFTAEAVDSLQALAVHLASHLSHETAIPRDRFGVTGSLLTSIHQPAFSDIDLVVYGQNEGWVLKRFLQGALEARDSDLTRHRGAAVAGLLAKWQRKYPLTTAEAADIYRRRWNYGFFHETPFSIHVVKPREEVHEAYGDAWYTPLRLVEGTARITAVEDSLVLPCTYGVDYLGTLDGEITVNTLVSYDGFYSGLFECGDLVQVKGKLEQVEDRRRRGGVYHRIVVGSLEAGGADFIKPLL